MTVAILGHGNVGGALARAMMKAGIRVHIAMIEGRPQPLPTWIEDYGIGVQPVSQAIREADALLLAVPFLALDSLMPSLKAELVHKVVIDCTNPVGPDLSHGLGSKQSGSEYLQALIPESYIAKCFSIYGFENLELPPTASQKPAMLIAADHEEARKMAMTLAEKTGWVPVHVGELSQALHLEHMTLLWIKMVRLRGMSPRTVWSIIQE